MKFRGTSSHSVCTECYKHKALISALSGHLNARQTQQGLFHQHLEDQFRDRVVYWQNRGESRSHSHEVTVIIDGMDQGKFCVPRHKSVHTKTLNGFSRPRLHLAAAICHGYFVAIFVTEHDVCKDSNTSLEMLSKCLDLLSQRVELAQTSVVIQCDNTRREVKNNHVFRWCAGAVSSGCVRSLSVSSLRSGHSHEDIDQLFGQIASYLKKLRCRLTSSDFVESLTEFSQTHMQRPFEKDRYVYKLDNVRDWPLDSDSDRWYVHF